MYINKYQKIGPFEETHILVRVIIKIGKLKKKKIKREEESLVWNLISMGNLCTCKWKSKFTIIKRQMNKFHNMWQQYCINPMINNSLESLI